MKFNLFDIENSIIHLFSLTNRKNEKPIKNKLVGYTLIIISFIYLFFFLLYFEESFKIIYQIPKSNIFGGLLCIIYFIILFLISGVFGQFCLIGRKLISKDGEFLLENLENNFCLYLRSFKIDEQIDSYNEWEDILVNFLKTYIGPTVAIGAPNEVFQKIGASRIYIEEGGDWQERVVQLAEKTSLIILSLGNSKGLIWEVEQSIKLNQPEKFVLFYVKFADKKIDKEHYLKFIELTKSLFPKKIPDYDEIKHKYSFITFDRDWNFQINKLPFFIRILNKLGQLTFLKTGDRSQMFFLFKPILKSTIKKISIKYYFTYILNILYSFFFLILNLILILALIVAGISYVLN